METFGERLKTALKRADMTQQQLADRLGVTQQSIQYACSPKGKGSKHALAISKILNVKADWLTYGIGSIQPSASEMVENAIGPKLDNLEKNIIRSISTPLIEWNQLTDPRAQKLATLIPCPTDHGPNTFATRVKDNTMTAQYGRSYPEGSIIYIDPDRAHEAQPGDRVFAIIEGEIPSFKLYGEADGERYLQSINLQYPIITREFEVKGLVIGMWMPEN